MESSINNKKLNKQSIDVDELIKRLMPEELEVMLDLTKDMSNAEVFELALCTKSQGFKMEYIGVVSKVIVGMHGRYMKQVGFLQSMLDIADFGFKAKKVVDGRVERYLK